MTTSSRPLRYSAAAAGFAEVVLAAWIALWLSSRQPLGFVGFTALLAAPGALLVLWAMAPRLLWVLPPVLAAGVSLLGLDVVDSSRSVIVTLGYAWFLPFVLLALVMFVRAHRKDLSRTDFKTAA